MPQDFLSPATKVKELEAAGESAMKASLAMGMPHGYEVGYPRPLSWVKKCWLPPPAELREPFANGPNR